jgi:hypothetical protein
MTMVAVSTDFQSKNHEYYSDEHKQQLSQGKVAVEPMEISNKRHY